MNKNDIENTKLKDIGTIKDLLFYLKLHKHFELEELNAKSCEWFKKK